MLPLLTGVEMKTPSPVGQPLYVDERSGTSHLQSCACGNVPSRSSIVSRLKQMAWQKHGHHWVFRKCRFKLRVGAAAWHVIGGSARDRERKMEACIPTGVSCI